MGDLSMEIEIPADNDGFVLLKCPLCEEHFKITPADFKDEGVLEICCPSCGLTSDDYLTDDVVELAMTKAKNFAMDMIHEQFKKMEKRINSKNVSFKAGKPPKHEYENPIHATIEGLEVTQFSCCDRQAKISPILRMSGCYCPFCGVKHFEVK